ncbi:LOW QUALITY PROTEIN: hypothetical protein OSB04_001702 [Centaurea solstitialis]|uniref:DUF4216 domain-containing protein n=1 Tax=Centaurea solstitialis TaxID=347529 RepID=A0AA38U225_9ASTR|nr:LOW QUALITY PROTEIN: hypothetical protein OSB04_001702 [Centaurea solstitialis]
MDIRDCTNTPLYEGCEESSLGTLLRAISLKEETGTSIKAFDENLGFQKSLLPTPNKLPKSYIEAKKILKGVGMRYEVIHACLNGCFLYYKEGDIHDQCPICGLPRYEDVGNKIPMKTVRYFPLTPRLQRLYMSKYTASHMRWHGQRETSPHDDVLSYPQFASDIRNVRIALSTFSPFGASATPYSLWPIVVIPYNLPPSITKITWEMSQCLYETTNYELKVLWETGFRTWDRYGEEYFMMKAAGINEPKLCWTHKSIFWELPYWKKSRVRHSLDVMHIEKNVCDNILGTILGFDGKSKDDLKARKTLEDMKIPSLAEEIPRHFGKANTSLCKYTVKPQFRLEVLDQIVAVQYPSDYAGSLKNKVSINDKKFYGLKTHDCHVLLQRILPMVIRPYVANDVADVICDLSRFFQMCARELKKSDRRYSLRLSSQSWFTYASIFLTGPVHYTWMFPIERQLGEYKKHVTNTRYPKGRIAKRYLMHEYVTFMNLYLNNGPVVHSNPLMSDSSRWSLSIVSDYVIPSSRLWNATLTREEIETARWMMADEQHSVQQELEILSRGPQQIVMYQQCNVNGVRFVCEERDESRKTQNSGVMIVADGVTYFGVLLQVVELIYPETMPVVLFKCRWYDEENTKLDRGLISIDTKTDCYKDSQFCLALHAKQVFYVNNPVFANGWKVVHHMFHRDIGPQYEVEEPYQEPVTTTIPICQIFIDIGPTPCIDIPNDDDENSEDYNENEENEYDSDDEEDDENDVLGINDGTDSDNDVNEFHNTNDEYRHDLDY